MPWLSEALVAMPIATLLLAVALGYGVGALPVGRYRLGPYVGTLLAAGALGQTGVHVDGEVRTLTFTLFIYTVGYLSGPDFFASLSRHALRELAMATFLAVVAAATLLLLAHGCALDAGTVAGLAAGALAQSAILGTAAEALAQLGGPGERLQANMAVAYAVSYLGGTLGAIVFCSDAVPWLMRRQIEPATAAPDRAAAPAPASTSTDVRFLCLGMAVGILLGRVFVPLGGFVLSLGSGGGALLAGLLFGRWRASRPHVGAFAPAAALLCRDLGLSAFIAAVGLNAATQALPALHRHGQQLFALGWVVTLLPLALTYAFGRYVLGYRQAGELAGALAGARSSNPALGAVLAKAGHDGPVRPFAVAYAAANMWLTLLGPLLVQAVTR